MASKDPRQAAAPEGHIRVRPYRQEDYARLCQIHDPARKNELALAGLPDAFLPLTIAAEREGLFEYRIYVAEYDGTAAGFAAFTGDEIAWLYVDTRCFRRGIGRALLHRVMQEMAAEVSLEVLAGNEPAIRLYSSLGFEITETVSGRMPGNEGFPVRVHVMRRPAPAKTKDGEA